MEACSCVRFFSFLLAILDPLQFHFKLESPFLFFRPCCVACGTLAPWSGVKSVPSAVEVESYHCTTREFLQMRTSCQKLKMSLEILVEFSVSLRYFGENEYLRNAEFPSLQAQCLSPMVWAFPSLFQQNFWVFFLKNLLCFWLFWFLTTWFISWLFDVLNDIFKKFIFQEFSGSPVVRTLAWPGFNP